MGEGTGVSREDLLASCLPTPWILFLLVTISSVLKHSTSICMHT